MQGVAPGPSLSQPGVSVPGEQVNDSAQFADEGKGVLLHGVGLGGESPVMVSQGVELLLVLLHVVVLVGGRSYAVCSAAQFDQEPDLPGVAPAAALRVLGPAREGVGGGGGDIVIVGRPRQPAIGPGATCGAL